MWLKLDLEGIIFKLQIRGYSCSPEEECDDKWCKTDFSFTSGEWLNYSRENYEVFLSSEVKILLRYLDKFLACEFSTKEELYFSEPDFEFTLFSKKETENSYMDMRIAFWNEDYMTNNFLSMTLDRIEIKYLSNYLKLVSGRMYKQSQEILDMIELGILYN